MKRTYTIEVDETEKGQRIRRTNDGFTGLELLGLLEMAKSDIMGVLKGKTENTADIVERRVVKEGIKSNN